MPLATNLDTEDRNDDTGDTPEDNHIFIAPIPGPTNTAHGWGHGTNQQNVNATLAWRGNTTVLERNPLSFILMCVNAGGGLNPRKKNRATDHTSRLLSSQRLVQDGIIDIMIITEADLDDTGVRNVREVIKEYSNDKVGCFAAQTSLHTTLMEYILSQNPVPRCTKGGVLLLIRQDLAQHITHVAHYRSGRILHIEITRQEQKIHILSVYGVSAPTSSKAKVKMARDVHNQLQTLLHHLKGQAIIVAGDLNTTPRPQDRSSQIQTPADKNENAIWRLLQEQGLIDRHAHAHPQRQDYTYFAQQRGSRLDAFWASAQLLDDQYQTAVDGKKGPLSADHNPIALNLTLRAFAQPTTQATTTTALPVYAYNAQSRPRRAVIQPTKAPLFTQHLSNDTTLNRAAEALLATKPHKWATTAQALTILHLDLITGLNTQAINQAITQAHARQEKTQPNKTGTTAITTAINQAGELLRQVQTQETDYDLTSHRKKVHEAVTNWTHALSDACRAAQNSKSKPNTNTPPPKAHGKPPLPTTHLLHLVNQLRDATDQQWPTLQKLREQIHTVVHKCKLNTTPPQAASARTTWQQWIDGDQHQQGVRIFLQQQASQQGTAVLTQGTLHIQPTQRAVRTFANNFDAQLTALDFSVVY